MDPKTASLLNTDIMTEVRRLYDIQADKIKLLNGFESFIFEFGQGEKQFILRLGHSSRRSQNNIYGEVDWINYLFDGGASVAKAVLSANGNLVESVDDRNGSQFLCTAFVKAQGGIAKKEHVNNHLFTNYGRLIGQIHALTKSYKPSNPAWKRYSWDSPENNTPDRVPRPCEKVLHEKYHFLLDHLQSLPKNTNDFGMIHQDAHLGNLFVDDEYNLTLFDFDDSVYGHFIYDIAMVFFYTSMWGNDDISGFIYNFMPVFFHGYKEFNKLDPKWLVELPNFLKLREINLYCAILFAYGEKPIDKWCATYMYGRREKIENDVPFINFDWRSLERYL